MQIVNTTEFSGQHIGTITRPLRRIVDGANLRNPGSEQEDSMDLLSTALGELKEDIRLLDRQGNEVGTSRYYETHWAYELGVPGHKSNSSFEPEYFRSAASFLEETEEAIGRLESGERAQLLDKLATNSRYYISKIIEEKIIEEKVIEETLAPASQRPTGENSYAAVKPKPAEYKFRGGHLCKKDIDEIRRKDFMELVAIRGCQRIVEQKLKRDSLYVNFKLHPNKIAENCDAIIPEKVLVEEWKKLRVPVSQAKCFLALTGREKEFEAFKNVSAPDAAMSGPKVDNRTGMEIKKFRTYIFIRAVLNTLDPKSAQEYYNSIPESALRKVVLPAGLSHLYGHRKNKSKEGWAIARDSYSNLIKMHSMSLRELLKAALSGELTEKSKDVEKSLGINFARTSLNKSEKNSLGLLARQALVNIAIKETDTSAKAIQKGKAVFALSELFDPQVPLDHLVYGDTPEDRLETAAELYAHKAGSNFEIEELDELLASSFVEQDRSHMEYLLRRMAFGPYGNLEKVNQMSHDLYRHTLYPKLLFLLPLTALLVLINILFINVNSTSLHAYYRDRLANAFKMKPTGRHQVAPDTGVLLSHLSDYDNGSIAPYHLFNAAINMCHSGQAEIRNRHADFFVFSKLYVGGEYTDYMETSAFQEYAPDVTIASAMANSGAAA